MDPKEVFAACERGNLARVQHIVAKDSTLLYRKYDLLEETLLHCACRYVYSSVPDRILPKGGGESGRVAYRKPLWAAACVRLP